MPGIREYFEKWDLRYESAPKMKNQYKKRFERISSFLIVAGLIFLALTISMGGLDSPEKIALYVMLLVITALFPVYGYRRVTEKSVNTGRRILRPSPPGFPVDPFSGEFYFSPKLILLTLKQGGKTILHALLALLLFSFGYGVILSILK